MEKKTKLLARFTIEVIETNEDGEVVPGHVAFVVPQWGHGVAGPPAVFTGLKALTGLLRSLVEGRKGDRVLETIDEAATALDGEVDKWIAKLDALVAN